MESSAPAKVFNELLKLSVRFNKSFVHTENLIMGKFSSTAGCLCKYVRTLLLSFWFDPSYIIKAFFRWASQSRGVNICFVSSLNLSFCVNFIRIFFSHQSKSFDRIFVKIFLGLAQFCFDITLILWTAFILNLC